MRVVVFGMLLFVSLTLQAAERPHGTAPTIMSGAIEIRTSANYEPAVIIAVDKVREGRRDGFADAAYVYYTDASVPNISHGLESAVLEDFGDRVIVSGGGKRLVFALLGANAVPPRKDDLENFTNGIGISRYYQQHVQHMAVLPDENTRVGCDGEGSGACYSDWSLGGGGGASSCPSGGPGTVSCSSECPGFSCSVTCGSGYYACCSCMYCKCVKG